MSAAPPSVQAVGMHKRFGRTHALVGVSLEARQGVTGLLGPNGAGKSTLLRLLATVMMPDAGRLRLLERDPTDSRQRTVIRRRLGYLPQEAGFHPNFTVFAFIDYVAILKEHTDRRARHREVRRVLEVLDLETFAGARLRTLSGGIRQRVALAQALLGDPQLLILDEPTAGLDPEHRLRLCELLARLGQERTIILATHHIEDVTALCHHVVAMAGGSVKFDGTPRELTELARGKVWLTASRHPAARVSWRTGEGRYRNLGDAPAGVQLVDPTTEDGYLLLLGEQALEAAA